MRAAHNDDGSPISVPSVCIDQIHSQMFSWFCGDTALILPQLPTASADMAVFSPPFQSLYTYSPTVRDLGNCRSSREFFRQFGYMTTQLRRVMKPGRNVCVHVQQVALQKAKDGVIGISDFRGAVIRHFQRHGFVLYGEATVDKCPQAQAIRTHTKGLAFQQLEKDSNDSRPAFADYLLIFKTPGIASVPIKPEVTRDEWIEWARPVWYGIKETDTLNTGLAREDRDERHMCPLQRGFIRRCVKLYSNRGEVVLSIFGGIASEGVVAVEEGRRFVGIELKPSYWKVGMENLRAAQAGDPQLSMAETMGMIGLGGSDTVLDRQEVACASAAA